MSPQEYFLTIIFLLLTLFWLGFVSAFIVGGAHRIEEGSWKSGVICIIVGIMIIILGVVGWHYLSNQPDWEFLKTHVCAECDAPISHSDKYCAECGYEVAVNNQCPECHTEYEEGDKYCAECGASIPQEK
ncbi:MAG: zinc ribbon domain-containing protein [Bacteroidaceae bacterium]|nr:zinc ribbon domain-containing protein [Bacteroidaceae bacterium]